jgi:hypothetical protein
MSSLYEFVSDRQQDTIVSPFAAAMVAFVARKGRLAQERLWALFNEIVTPISVFKTRLSVAERLSVLLELKLPIAVKFAETNKFTNDSVIPKKTVSQTNNDDWVLFMSNNASGKQIVQFLKEGFQREVLCVSRDTDSLVKINRSKNISTIMTLAERDVAKVPSTILKTSLTAFAVVPTEPEKVEKPIKKVVVV